MAVSLAVIIILGLAADYLFRRLNLPGLVGMLLVGIVVGPHVLDFCARKCWRCPRIFAAWRSSSSCCGPGSRCAGRPCTAPPGRP